MLKSWRFVLLAVLAALATVGPPLWLVSQLHPSAGQPPQTYSENADKEGTAEKADDRIARYTWWLATLTAILSGATIGLMGSTFFQLRLARDEFNATHRPVMNIRSVHTLTRGNTASIGFVYVNRGIGRAKNIEIGCACIIDDFIRREAAFEIQKVSGVTLESGESALHDFRPQRNGASFDQAQGFDEGTVPVYDTPPTVFLVGFISYDDALGRRRETGFCRRNAPGSTRWLKVENSEYEYED